MKHDNVPYLSVVDEPRVMKGKGAPRSTVFGVLGHTKETGMTRTLGGLVQNSASASIQKGTLKKPGPIHTERGITGPAAKTHISGLHHGMTPYPGAFMAHAGQSL